MALMLGSGICIGTAVPSVGGYAAETASAPLSFLRKSLIDVTTSWIVTTISTRQPSNKSRGDLRDDHPYSNRSNSR